jgi:hypothetical protein
MVRVFFIMLTSMFAAAIKHRGGQIAPTQIGNGRHKMFQHDEQLF